MNRKKIPYGISNFEKLIKENYYFIDKTKYIEILENLNEQYLIYLRPRRFGKSLFVSMLEYYYGIEYKDNNLFNELYIGKKPTQKRNSYYILKFNFSGINTNTDEKTRKGFNNNIIESIKNFIFNYELDEYKIKENHEASDILRTFFSYVRKKIKGKIYVLIDEYDHFANEILGFNYEFFKKSVAQNGFVRKFYEELKNETGSGLVDRIFITGVTPITLDSLTSGFNIG
ncbi:MAG: 9-O-acetyl-N-acetylneuraminate esterase, partial [Fusobacteriia bacterium 4572_132]